MIRRAFLNALAVISTVSVPGRLVRPGDVSSPPTERVNQEGNMWFWYYVYSAVQKDRVMSTEQSREQAVSEMNLAFLSDAEAHQILERANNGEYTISDMPDQWLEVFDSLDQVEFR